MHSDYRHDPFTDASTATTITGEVQMIPAGSPYTIRLNEVPMKETPSSITMRIRDVLTAAIATAGATSCAVMNGSWFAINDVITIDNEQMLVTNVVSNTLTITRGYNSTTAATHSANIAVYGPTWSEVAATPAARQYWPDYGTSADNDDMWNTGTVQFNSADAGKILDIAYKGTGTLAGVNPAKNWPACFSEYGDGSDGHFISSGSDTIDGLKQYKSFVVQAGHTVTVGANPLTILCQGAVLIAGTINGAGANGNTGSASTDAALSGGAGKGGGGNGGTVTTGNDVAVAVGGNATGAGGGRSFVNGYAMVGIPGTGNLDGVVIAEATAVPASLAALAARLLRHSAGAGGGGGAGAQKKGGGGGGGSVMLVARRIVNTGTLNVAGGAVGSTTSNWAGSGGGGGASIRIVALLIRFTGTINANGGNGGAGDAVSLTTIQAGGNGWSKVIEIGG